MTKNEKANDAVPPVTNLIEAMQEASTSMMSSFGPDWVATMSTVGTEMLSFVSERIKQDIQTQQDLLKAKGLAEVQQIQAAFIKRTMDDYTTEMGKLMDLGKHSKRHATPV
ncbi:phasin family protein [Sulfitobacter sp.]|uniref:phasin family protein n=1 Tax=Sulfitobacter sp. TaxID=1903071 RepID=UPI003EF9CDC3